MKLPLIFVLCIFILPLKSAGQVDTYQISRDLVIKKINENVFLHISNLNIPDTPPVPCNGLVYIYKNQAFIIDTPVNDSISTQLINWMSITFPGIKVKGIISTHFHVDCLGGLKTFHAAGISSYSHRLTPELLKKDTVNSTLFESPKITFDKQIKLKLGRKDIICFYPGKAHTSDNIAVWLHEEKILFGGCMIKSMNAGKGNLADANLIEWSSTINKVKEKFPEAERVIPGHGEPGGKELLDYTIQLFRNN